MYLTVNTLVKNEEFDELLDMIIVCVDAKVDAYIVQDFGVAYILKNTFKNINLHASTQMGIHNLMGAQVAEKFGFIRVVLSRETTLEDIQNISQNTNLEIEYFVQGALCVAFMMNLAQVCVCESMVHFELKNNLVYLRALGFEAQTQHSGSAPGCSSRCEVFSGTSTPWVRRWPGHF